MRKLFTFYTSFILLYPLVFSQTPLTLQDAIQQAQQNSMDALLGRNNYEISEQNFRLQRAQLFPQINLNANVPGYNSSISSVTQPDGTVKFTEVEQGLSNVGVSISQKIAATGGNLSLNSNLNRFDRLSGNAYTNYNSQPFLLGFNQPVFRFNETKFSTKTARLNRIIGTKSFVKSNENIALKVSQLYYQTLQTQENIRLAEFNLQTTDTLLHIAQNKLELGKINEEEYLQVQLQSINLKAQLKQLKMSYTNTKTRLLQLLELPENTEVSLNSASSLVNASAINESLFTELLQQAKNNTPEFEQQKLNATQTEATMKRAKFNMLPNFNITASYGTNQSGNQLDHVYQNLLNQKSLTLGVAVPLFTSGANGASYQIARYQLNNQQLQMQLFERQIANDLLFQIRQYNMSIETIKDALLTDSIAQRRYQISINKYKAGKLTYTDLLNAQLQRDQSQLNVINATATYWQTYYQLRVNTLYDFEKGVSLYRGE